MNARRRMAPRLGFGTSRYPSQTRRIELGERLARLGRTCYTARLAAPLAGPTVLGDRLMVGLQTLTLPV